MKGSLKMNKWIPSARYLLRDCYGIAVIGFFSSVAIMFATDLVFNLTNRYNAIPAPGPVTVPLEMNAGFLTMAVGVAVCIRNLKVMLANGISRKTFFAASLPVAALSGIVLAITILGVVAGHGLFRPVVIISRLMYPHSSLAALFFTQAAFYCFMLLAGWLVALAYYRAGVLARWLLTLTPLVLIAIWIATEANGQSAVSEAIHSIWLATIGGSSATWAGVCWLILTTAAAGGLFLLLRRTPLRSV